MSEQSDAALLIDSPAYLRAIEALKASLTARLLATPSGMRDVLSEIKAQFEALEALDTQVRRIAKPDRAKPQR